MPAIPPAAPSPRGMTAIGVFLLFGATMACIAGITLVQPGTVLDRMWALNPFSGLGWFKRQRWGWQLAVIIIAIQVFGDFVNVFHGHPLQGGIGIAIAGALLVYILRPNIRAAFVSEQQSSGN